MRPLNIRHLDATSSLIVLSNLHGHVTARRSDAKHSGSTPNQLGIACRNEHMLRDDQSGSKGPAGAIRERSKERGGARLFTHSGGTSEKRSTELLSTAGRRRSGDHRLAARNHATLKGGPARLPCLDAALCAPCWRASCRGRKAVHDSQRGAKQRLQLKHAINFAEGSGNT